MSSSIRTPVNIPAVPNTNARRLVRTSDGHLHAVYSAVVGAAVEIYYAESTDNGLTWGSTAISTMGGANSSINPTIAKDSADDLHVAWSGPSPLNGFPHIRYRKCTAGIWGAVTEITASGLYYPWTFLNYHQNCPAIAVDGTDQVHIVWWGKTALDSLYQCIYYINFSGGIWNTILNLNADTNREHYYPTLDFDSANTMHIAWTRHKWGTNDEVQLQYRNRTSAGVWGGAAAIYTQGAALTYAQTESCLVVDSDDNIHVVWAGQSAASPAIYQIRYLKHDGAWSTVVDLTAAAVNQRSPSIASSGVNLYLTWRASDLPTYANQQIHLMTYKGSWSVSENLTQDLIEDNRYAFLMRRSINSDGFNFVWYDNVDYRYWGYAYPDVDFTKTPDPQQVGYPVQFRDTSTIASGTIIGWDWTFGDGESSSLQHPSHVYSTTGVKSVTLRVLDNSGKWNE